MVGFLYIASHAKSTTATAKSQQKTIEDALQAQVKTYLDLVQTEKQAEADAKRFQLLIEQFPQQYLNVGVAEQNMMGIATGLSLKGYTVFAYSIANFGTMRCYEQIRNDICYHDANVKILVSGGGLSYGALGMSHHATEDIAVMRVLPNMNILTPCDEGDTYAGSLYFGKLPGPAYLRLEKGAVPQTSVRWISSEKQSKRSSS